jgi:nucleotide-binding universal stress UspA family protein
MGRYIKILAAYDGSASGDNALRQAMALADKEHSWVKVLAVVPSYEGDLELVGVRDMASVMRGPVENLVRSARKIAGPDSANLITNVEQGEVFEKIIDVAESENCDLIVMGRRGLRRLERMLIGSVTERVIGHTGKDVLVVPRDAALNVSNLLAATDGSPHGEAAIDRALYFAQQYGVKMTAVCVVDMLPEYYADAPDVVAQMDEKASGVLEAVRQKATGAGVEVDIKVLRGDPADEISNLAKQANAGMVFVGSHGRSGIKKLLLGSVAEKVIGLAPCPVLVAKP